MTDEEKMQMMSALLKGAHIEQVNMGDGYQYNGCTITNNPKKTMNEHFEDAPEAEVLPNTPEEAVKMALEWLMEERDEKGAYLFTAQNQWAGIYRVMLDKGLCEQNVSAFCRYIASLNLNYHDGLNAPVPKSHAFDNLPSSYDKWEPKIGDDTDEKKHKVATKFKSKLTELLPK